MRERRRHIAIRRIDLTHSLVPAHAAAIDAAKTALVAGEPVAAFLLVRGAKNFLIGGREVYDAAVELAMSHVPARYVRAYPARPRRRSSANDFR